MQQIYELMFANVRSIRLMPNSNEAFSLLIRDRAARFGTPAAIEAGGR